MRCSWARDIGKSMILLGGLTIRSHSWSTSLVNQLTHFTQRARSVYSPFSGADVGTTTPGRIGKPHLPMLPLVSATHSASNATNPMNMTIIIPSWMSHVSLSFEHQKCLGCR